MNFIPPQDETRLRAAASGVLPNGKPVVVNADGTVSIVSGDSFTQSAGSAQVFESATTAHISSAFDSNSNRLVIGYQDQGNSSYGTVVVATVGETSLTFGTPVVFNSGGTRTYPSSAVFDSNLNKIVIFFQDEGDGDKGKAIVGTVNSSNNSISFGSEVAFDTSGASSEIAATFDSNANKIVIFYRDGGDTNKGISFVATVSGTSISFGSATEVTENNSDYNAISFDSTANKVVAVWMDGSDSNRGKARVGTVSGTSISFGDNTNGVQFSATNNSKHTSVAYDPDQNKTVIAYIIGTASGTAIVGTISGTSISFGTAVNFNSGNTNDTVIVYDTLANKVVIAYKDQGNSGKGTAITGTVSGTSISFDSELAFEAGLTSYLTSTFVPTVNRTVFAFQDEGNSNYGTSVVFTAGYSTLNLTAENYVGMSGGGQVASGSSATVDIIGTVANIPEEFFSLNSAVYANKSFNVSSQESNFLTFFIGNSGTKFYALGYANDTVYQYTLSTAWDISTASYDSVSFSVSSQVSVPRTLTFKPDGTKMYMGDYPTLYQYTLSTAWNVSTASYDSVTFTPSSQTNLSHDVIFSPDGTKLYNTDLNGAALFQYTLSTPYNIGTASYANKTLSTSSQDNTPYGLALNLDGTKLFLLGGNSKTVFQYNLSTAYDISTGVYSNISFDASAQGNQLIDCQFSSDGSKLYICSPASDAIFQYNTFSSLTPGQSYFVQADATLGLTADDPSVFAGTAISATKLLVKT